MPSVVFFKRENVAHIRLLRVGMRSGDQPELVAGNVEYVEICDFRVVSTNGDLEIKAASAHHRPQNQRRRLRCLRHRQIALEGL
jgi:hypothetical protein